jgi:hypothetical protein
MKSTKIMKKRFFVFFVVNIYISHESEEKIRKENFYSGRYRERHFHPGSVFPP